MSLAEIVRKNLLFQNLWTEVTEVKLPNEILLEGLPKEPLLNDESTNSSSLALQEYVFPIRINEKLTPKRLKEVFDSLEITRKRPRRIVIGIVNNDGTVVYYFIHDGVYKPKKN